MVGSYSLRRILLDQLDDRIKRALSLIVLLYPKLKEKELEPEEVKGLLDIVEGLQCFLKVIVDIQYNENISAYEQDVDGIARDEDEW